MSQPAFFFDPNLCTGCAACAIACQIENDRLPGSDGAATMHWRTIYTRNPENDLRLESFHLSLACNHCLEPACLQACPAAAITKDSLTGAVLINPERCIGCGYCSWACPFDAPKYSKAQGVMEKCTFCQPRLMNGSQPACTVACPTGALHMGLLSQEIPGMTAGLSGFPKTRMKPAVRFEPLRSGPANQAGGMLYIENEGDHPNKVRVAPETALGGLLAMSLQTSDKISLKHEWPLWVITVTMPVLFAWFAGLEPARHVPYAWLDAGMLAAGLLALGVSTLHLGKPLRAWRALSNANTSWLSREILFAVIYLVLCGAAYGLTRIGTNDFLFRSGPLVQGSLVAVGFLALVSIDQVYSVLRTRDRPYSNDEIYRPRIQLHSGSALLGGLFMAGLMAAGTTSQGQGLGMVLVIIGVIAGVIQLCLYATRHAGKEPGTPIEAMVRFVRVVFGFVLPGLLLAAGASAWAAVGFAWVGFAVDRTEFYEGLRRVIPGW